MEDILKIQKNEITEHYVYAKLAEIVKKDEHKKILLQISKDELEHYNILKEITSKEVEPSKIKIYLYTIISQLLGLNFGLKLMERNEVGAEEIYKKSSNIKLRKLMEYEKEHENKLISMIDEEILNYVSSIVLGLNDALVELSGALTGFTLALGNSKIVAIVGFITGFAASLSMGVSNYLSIKNDTDLNKHPIKSAFYTFGAYLFTVIILITPYFLFSNVYISLSAVIIMVIVIIAIFNFYTAIARNLNFKKRFFEMISLSMSVAFINYIIGYIIKQNFNIDV
ncbi:MAG: VIT1/CCC1 family protein [Elusimicrobiota bacterium]